MSDYKMKSRKYVLEKLCCTAINLFHFSALSIPMGVLGIKYLFSSQRGVLRTFLNLSQTNFQQLNWYPETQRIGKARGFYPAG